MNSQQNTENANADPSVKEIANWSKEKLAGRAVILALICADRKDRKDSSWEWADKELRKIAPLINGRFS